MPKTAILDFDDLCDANDPFDALTRLKARDPNFKVTLFGIPTRMSPALVSKYAAARDWIQIGIHGWRHSRHECLAWTAEETVEKVTEARRVCPDFAPIFKAPNWEIDSEVYAGLKAIGLAVADHIRNIEILPSDSPHYIYNLRLRNDPFTKLHGHIQPWVSTGLTENPDDALGINPLYVLPIGTPYAFCTEAVESHKRVEV